MSDRGPFCSVTQSDSCISAKVVGEELIFRKVFFSGNLESQLCLLKSYNICICSHSYGFVIFRWQPEGLDAKPAPQRHKILQAEALSPDFSEDGPDFGASFEPRPDQGFAAGRKSVTQRLGLRSKTAARLSAPELLDEGGPFFDDSADQPTPRGRKVAFTCLPHSPFMTCTSSERLSLQWKSLIAYL